MLFRYENNHPRYRQKRAGLNWNGPANIKNAWAMRSRYREFAVSKSLPPAETQKAEAQLLLKAIPAKATVVVLDERGKDMPSHDFAAKLAAWQDQGMGDLVFIIGGADGVTDAIRAKANLLFGFGRLTWPHRLVRVMLLEQIYRAKQIIAGHPYHRD